LNKSTLVYRILGFFRRNSLFLLGLLLLLSIVFLVIAGRLYLDPNQYRVFANPPNLPPSLEHPLGTQSEGRDILGLLVIGIPATLKIGLIGGGVGLTVGMTLGLISGYFGGRIDAIIRYIVDVGLTIPPLAILIMIAASIQEVTVGIMGLVVASTSWMFSTRVIRSQVLSLKERNFVWLNKLSGAGNFHIIFVEILPNLLPFLAASFVSALSSAILSSLGLEVLGLGPKDTPTLGATIYYAIYYTAMWRGIWWWWLPPIIVLMIIFTGLFLISASLDVFANPRLRRL